MIAQRYFRADRSYTAFFIIRLSAGLLDTRVLTFRPTTIQRFPTSSTASQPYLASMPDFTDNLKPAEPTGPSILAKERNQSDVPVDELAQHLLARNGFLERQARILPLLEKDPLFRKTKQQNLSRPERYQLGLARAKKTRRLADQHGWDQEDFDMSTYLSDDVSPYNVHIAMFITTVKEQGDEQQRAYWLPKIMSWEVVGCYAQ